MRSDRYLRDDYVRDLDTCEADILLDILLTLEEIRDMPGMKNTMGEFKRGQLRSGSKKGPVVKSRAQAIAIGLSEDRRAKGQQAKRLTGKKL